MNKCKDKIGVGKLFNFKLFIDYGLKLESSKLFILIFKSKDNSSGICSREERAQYMWHMFVLIK